MSGNDIQIEAFKKMTGAQKLKLAMGLYWSARRLKAAWLRQLHPDWTQEEIEAQVTEIFKHART